MTFSKLLEAISGCICNNGIIRSSGGLWEITDCNYDLFKGTNAYVAVVNSSFAIRW